MAKPRINQFTISFKGKRRVNEDRVLAIKVKKDSNGSNFRKKNAFSNLLDRFEFNLRRKENRILVAVADGMGGYQRGDWASEKLISELTRILEANSTDDYLEVSHFIRSRINGINERIFKESQKLGNQMGCTVSGALVLGYECLFFNVGDSRTYVVSSDKIERMTVDHSADEDAIRKGLIGEEDRGKSEYSHALTRSIGTDPEVEIDIFPKDRFYSLNKGDIIFACTDGLWNVVNDRDIWEHISRGGNNLKKSLSALVKHAFHRGSKDNISAAAIAYGKYHRQASNRTGQKIVHHKALKDWKRLPILVLSVILASLSIFFAIKFYNNLPQPPEKVAYTEPIKSQEDEKPPGKNGAGNTEQTNSDNLGNYGNSSPTQELHESAKKSSSQNKGKTNTNNLEQSLSENRADSQTPQKEENEPSKRQNGKDSDENQNPKNTGTKESAGTKNSTNKLNGREMNRVQKSILDYLNNEFVIELEENRKIFCKLSLIVELEFYIDNGKLNVNAKFIDEQKNNKCPISQEKLKFFKREFIERIKKYVQSEGGAKKLDLKNVILEVIIKKIKLFNKEVRIDVECEKKWREK